MGIVRAVRKWGLRITVVVVTVFAVLQLVPYGWTHANPRVVQDAPWQRSTRYPVTPTLSVDPVQLRSI